MIVPYRERRSGGAIRYLPLVTVSLSNHPYEFSVNALVDSGAEHNVFSLDVAKRLHLDYENEEPVELTTIAGTAEGYVTSLDLQLGRRRWSAPVVFTKAMSHQGILGQQGFFKFFTVTFRYHRRDMNIRWAGARQASRTRAL